MKPLKFGEIVERNSIPTYTALEYGHKVVLSRALHAYGVEVGEFARNSIAIEILPNGNPRVYRKENKDFDNPVLAQKLAVSIEQNAAYNCALRGCELYFLASKMEPIADNPNAAAPIEPTKKAKSIRKPKK